MNNIFVKITKLAIISVLIGIMFCPPAMGQPRQVKKAERKKERIERLEQRIAQKEQKRLAQRHLRLQNSEVRKRISKNEKEANRRQKKLNRTYPWEIIKFRARNRKPKVKQKLK